MSSMDQRERDFENRYAHDQELQFRVEARRNRLVGLWAAAKLGRTGPEADAYASEVIEASFEKVGDGDIMEKLSADFAAAGVQQSRHQIERTIAEMGAEARRQVMAE